MPASLLAMLLAISSTVSCNKEQRHTEPVMVLQS